jgi:hypothetical protein
LNRQLEVRILRIVTKYECHLLGIPMARQREKPNRYFSFPSRGNGPVKAGHRAASARQDFFYRQYPRACIPELERVKVVVSFTYQPEIEGRF